MAVAIKAENLSKAYRLGEIGTGTLSRDIERWFAKVRGKEDPFLKIGEANDRTTKGTSDVVWSLKDISFEIQQGDAVGIIGKNGAGKSTLLKLLSRVTSPTIGNIKVKGRIASLLEVGTGFHPELTGRENIYLNGAILGMRKKEIARKFDEIVDFSGVDRYIDTPVKRYSSGMYVRLAFAVAAHLESETLIVDEVLAVGDAEFQKKCINKMQELNIKESRTVLFVTHNMSLVSRFCNKGVLLENGVIKLYKEIKEVISAYNKSNDINSVFNPSLEWKRNKFSRKLDLLTFKITDSSFLSKTTFLSSEEIMLHFKIEVKELLKLPRIVLFVYVGDNTGTLAFMSSTKSSISFGNPGEYNIICKVPAKLLNQGLYDIYIQIGEPGVGVIIEKFFLSKIECILAQTHNDDYQEKWEGVVNPYLNWTFQ